jgi:uncharacterized protein (TIGR02231 family)
MRFTHPVQIVLIFLSVINSANAQTKQKLNIDEAVVFLNGAELTSSAKVNLVKGENEILFTNVAGDVNNQSINVSATNGVVVAAAAFQNNYLGDEVLSARAREIKDSIETMTEARKLINDKLTVITEEIAVLFNNKKVGGDNTGLSVTELTKLLDLYNSRYEGYLNQKGRQEELQRKSDERIAKLKRQLDEEQKKGVQPGGQMLVKFYAKEAVSAAIVIDYIVPNAGWSPTYDVMADAVNMPVKLYYKANIHQSSGVSWNNVKLTLSTGNPNEGVNAPALNPWYLAFYVPPPPQPMKATANHASMKKARGEGDAMYAIDGVQVQKEEESSINDYVSVDNAGVNTNFEIDLPYTIPCDGKQHLVAIKKYELPSTYRYFAVPKLDKDVFLQAQLTKWEDLNLLPGTTNIFYEGTYVGQGMIDVRNVKDTFTISLGRDKKIVVKRDRDTQRRSVKTIGTNVREEFAYSITIRNTRKENISLTIQDQMPVSNDKDIVLEDLDYGGASTEENTGLMNWNVQMNPNETKKLEFGFTVKYPKGKTINNLR